MSDREKLDEVLWRAQELSKQLTERAKLCRLLKVPELALELERMDRVEVQPIIKLCEEGHRVGFSR